MKRLPIAEWLASLDRIDAAVADTLARLDHYETNLGDRFADRPPAPALAAAGQLLAALETRLGEHDRRMAAAEAEATAFEQSLQGQQQSVEAWRDGVSRVAQRIQQPTPGPALAERSAA